MVGSLFIAAIDIFGENVDENERQEAFTGLRKMNSPLKLAKSVKRTWEALFHFLSFCTVISHAFVGHIIYVYGVKFTLTKIKWKAIEIKCLDLQFEDMEQWRMGTGCTKPLVEMHSICMQLDNVLENNFSFKTFSFVVRSEFCLCSLALWAYEQHVIVFRLFGWLGARLARLSINF